MHELSLCRALLQQAERIAFQHRQPAISQIRLRIGPLAGVDPALLHQAFHAARQHSIASDAELHIEAVPLQVHCPHCRQVYPASLPRLACPVCGASNTRLHSGDELLLVSIAFPQEQAHV